MTQLEKITHSIYEIVSRMSTATSTGSTPDIALLNDILQELQDTTDAIQQSYQYNDAYATNIQYAYTLFNGETVVQTKTCTFPGAIVFTYTYSYAIENGQTVVTQIVKS